MTWCTGAGAATAERNLAEFDLATLMSMDVVVTSAAKRAQVTEDAAAAVYVLTRDDIRRSGAVTIPDLLRLVPGVQVARVNTRTWAVTSRGFNSQFANKLQVLVDGRSIYAMVFSGVMWEEQFVPIDQIERVEVVRGPGGALWGINAVNGVINIITRPAGAVEGLAVAAGAGDAMKGASSAHYGAQTGLGNVDLYGEYAEADPYANDPFALDRAQVGVRFERTVGADHFTAHAEYTDGEYGRPVAVGSAAAPPIAEISTLGMDWRRDYASGARTSVGAYHSATDRGVIGGWDESTTGLDAQYTGARSGRHLMTFGAGYRYVTDEVRDPRAKLAFTKSSLAYHQWGVYLQDETFWLDDRVRLIAGAKLEDFKYTGRAFQPTLRGLWHIDERHTLWSAVSRAARTPSRMQLHAAIEMPIEAPMPGPPVFVSASGNEDLSAEELTAYEIGWRWRANDHFTLDAALFHNDYDELITQVQRAPMLVMDPTPRVLLPVRYENSGEVTTHGAELSLEWRAAERLRLLGGAQWFESDLPPTASPLERTGADPKYGWTVRMQFDPSPTTELDLALRAVAKIEKQSVPGYESLDLRFGWRPSADVELWLALENALDDEHIEFVDEVTQTQGVTIGRSAFARILWRLGH